MRKLRSLFDSSQSRPAHSHLATKRDTVPEIDPRNTVSLVISKKSTLRDLLELVRKYEDQAELKRVQHHFDQALIDHACATKVLMKDVRKHADFAKMKGGTGGFLQEKLIYDELWRCIKEDTEKLKWREAGDVLKQEVLVTNIEPEEQTRADGSLASSIPKDTGVGVADSTDSHSALSVLNTVELNTPQSPGLLVAQTQAKVSYETIDNKQLRDALKLQESVVVQKSEEADLLERSGSSNSFEVEPLKFTVEYSVSEAQDGNNSQDSSLDNQLMTYDLASEFPVPSCVVCTEVVDDELVRFPEHRISGKCNHEPSTCTQCLQNIIKTDLKGKMWNEMRCPECAAGLTYEDVLRLADTETFRL